MISKEILEKIKPGAVVRVTEIVKEGAKTRESRFQGIVLARKHGKEIGATFTVRGDVAMIGVEKVYPINSPMIEKVEIMSSPAKSPALSSTTSAISLPKRSAKNYPPPRNK